MVPESWEWGPKGMMGVLSEHRLQVRPSRLWTSWTSMMPVGGAFHLIFGEQLALLCPIQELRFGGNCNATQPLPGVRKGREIVKFRVGSAGQQRAALSSISSVTITGCGSDHFSMSLLTDKKT